VRFGFQMTIPIDTDAPLAARAAYGSIGSRLRALFIDAIVPIDSATS
jgi:hypothetical protein